MGKRKQQESDYQDIEYLRRQLHKARNKGDFKEIGNVLNQLGVIYRERKDFDAALEEHEEEIRITKKHFPKDKIPLAIAYRAKAEVYIEMNDQANALPLVKEYLKLALEASDLVEEQRAHVTLGRVFLGLAQKCAEEDNVGPDLKMKALQRSEKEFRKARDLLNHDKVRSQQSESGLMDMKCGVFINLAIVLELKEQLEESKQFFMKAIEIGKKHSLFEHVYRSYLNLNDIHWKTGNHKEACNSAEEAAKAAKTLGNLVMEVEAKLLEAKAYFALDEVETGVKLLKRTRNQQIKFKEQSNEELMSETESLLKCGVRIQRAEDVLDVTVPNKFDKRKQLHERLADNYVGISAYSSAISHYKKAIECAESAMLDESEMAKLYFSLAETYKDSKDYLNALKYLEKEIALHSENPNEAFKTQTNITVIMECAKMNVDEIIDAHEKAVCLSKLCDSPRKEVLALKNKSNYFKIVNLKEEAEDLVTKYKEIQRLHNLPDECEFSQELDVESDTDSIDLDNLSSDDGESDEEQHKIIITSKKKKIRLNEKGETPLHIAAQKGDIKAVRRLIQERHSVNARDSAGWTPLHEACNFGAVEVVETLLEHGANVNDPGGRFCDKITPMHDAASNGHIDVMSVILKYNPNVLAKTSLGNFVVDELINWKARNNVELDEESLQKYVDMKKELITRMEKAGFKYQQKDEARAKRERRERSASPKSMLLRGKHGDIPVKAVIDDFDPNSGEGAVDFYSSTMQQLRGKSRRRKSSTNRKSSEMPDEYLSDNAAEALIPESQNVGDDWLENDLPESKIKTKRKRDPLEDVRMIDRSMKRIRSRRNITRLDVLGGEEDVLEYIEGGNEDEAFDDEYLQDADFEDAENSRSSLHRVFDESFDEPTIIENTPVLTISDDEPGNENYSPEIINDSDSDESQFPRNRRFQGRRIIQTKLPFKTIESTASARCTEREENRTLPIAERTSQSNSSIRKLPKPLRLKVRIGDKALLVPVAQEHMMNSIDWLCEECARRYSENSGLKPIITLSTIDGALLSGSDIIHFVLNDDEVELVGNITSVDLPRLPERFRALLSKHPDLDPTDANGILMAFEMCQSSNKLNLSDFSLHGQMGQVTFQAIKYQQDLKELILSECVLQDEGVKHLASIIPTLPSLTTLDLCCNGITSDGLHELVESFKKKPDIQLNKSSTGLTSLNLSFNPLGNSASSHIMDLLLQFPQLKALLLADCDFNVRFLAESRVIDTFKKMSLEELDLSYNPLGSNGTNLLLQSMPPDQFSPLHLKTTSCFSTEVL